MLTGIEMRVRWLRSRQRAMASAAAGFEQAGKRMAWAGLQMAFILGMKGMSAKGVWPYTIWGGLAGEGGGGGGGGAGVRGGTWRGELLDQLLLGGQCGLPMQSPRATGRLLHSTAVDTPAPTPTHMHSMSTPLFTPHTPPFPSHSTAVSERKAARSPHLGAKCSPGSTFIPSHPNPYPAA